MVLGSGFVKLGSSTAPSDNDATIAGVGIRRTMGLRATYALQL